MGRVTSPQVDAQELNAGAYDAGRLPFSEAFGPTLQGEGPHAGRPAMFLRLGGCNLSCSWCDSAYTWDASRYPLREEITMLSPRQVVAKVQAHAPILVVTGGEPLLNQRNPAWRATIEPLGRRFEELHLETNGTIAPDPFTLAAFRHISVSPKLANAGEHKPTQHRALHPAWVHVSKAILKVVVETPEDVVNAARLAHQHGIDRHRVWVMPQGQTPEELAQRWPAIAGTAAVLRINATHRLHVLAWGVERGH